MSAGDMEDTSHIQAETSFEVQLYIYDLSKGLAKTLSSMFLGDLSPLAFHFRSSRFHCTNVFPPMTLKKLSKCRKQLPGIWHTSIVAYGREYFFGSMGIESCGVGETILKEPDQILSLGRTELPYSLFLEYIFALGESSYKPHTYDLFRHNCNNFTQEVAVFLTGKSIPQEILDLPDEFLSTPLGGTLQTYFENLSLRGETARGLSFGGGAPSDFIPFPPSGQRNSAAADSNGELEDRPPPVRKSRRYSDPPVFYPQVDGAAALKELEAKLEGVIDDQERAALRELHEYLVTDNGAWALGTPQLDLFQKLLNDPGLSSAVRLSLLRVLQAAALKEDVILFLHQDRKSHCIMSYVHRIESLPPDEQDEVLKLLCNLCSNVSSYDWLLYISDRATTAKATVRAVVQGLLCDRPAAQERAAALMFNLSLKELFDDTATELSTAILQYLHGDVKEEQAFYCLTALLRFLQISYNDVPALVKMLGPDLQKFSGASERVKKLIDEINLKLSVSISAPALEGVSARFRCVFIVCIIVWTYRTYYRIYRTYLDIAPRLRVLGSLRMLSALSTRRAAAAHCRHNSFRRLLAHESRVPPHYYCESQPRTPLASALSLPVRRARMDLGDCPKIHDLALRADYESASKKKDYFYDVDAMEHLQNFIGECDRRTEQAKRRLAETQEELSAEVTLKLNRVHELAESMGKKLAAAEAKGADGNVEESLKLLEEVEEIRRKKAEAEQDYRNSMPASSYQQQKLRVCDVCSAYLGIHDNDRRLADHFGGKLHLGFIAIREKLAQLKQTVTDKREKARAAELIEKETERRAQAARAGWRGGMVEETRSRSRSPGGRPARGCGGPVRLARGNGVTAAALGREVRRRATREVPPKTASVTGAGFPGEEARPGGQRGEPQIRQVKSLESEEKSVYGRVPSRDVGRSSAADFLLYITRIDAAALRPRLFKGLRFSRNSPLPCRESVAAAPRFVMNIRLEEKYAQLILLFRETARNAGYAPPGV
ncbi:hypothetical protein HPB48_015936 [Haemaphysalis longicornis]|uniref:PPPDE domain-containing protein n=1 Tax=Haemaphysalis longicornis TaxID=44386 RepID=A0A9J6FG11_HAELO|nr:hypothetical protein HPB48_015936 [Haemaphysalis longicornis]